MQKLNLPGAYWRGLAARCAKKDPESAIPDLNKLYSPTLRPTNNLLVPPTDASSAHPSSSSSREFLRPTAVAAALLTPPPDNFPTSLRLSSNASATRSSSLPTPQRLDTAQLYSNGAGNQVGNVFTHFSSIPKPQSQRKNVQKSLIFTTLSLP